MSQRNVFLALPEELFAEARELARLRHISVSDLLIEALSESIETQQRNSLVAEATLPMLKGKVRVH